MSDDPIRDALDARSGRGQERGADQVWTDAAEPSYVSPAPPTMTRWPLVAGAAAAALLLVAGIVGGVALLGPDDPGDEFAAAGDQPGDAPATCLLVPSEQSSQSLTEWKEALESMPGVSSSSVQVLPQSGTAVIYTFGQEPLQVPSGTNGVSFAVRPVSAVDHLLDDPEIDELTCTTTPPGYYIPEHLPEGTEVLIVFLDPNGGTAVHDLYPELIERDEARAVELKDREATWVEFQELFADEPELVDAVTPEVLPESIRLLVDESSAAALQAELEVLSGVYRVVRATETDQ